MKLEEMVRISLKLLPPPLSALPAKYHAPISLLVHSLSSGMLAHDLAELAGLEDYKDIAFLLGLSHDIHQKLVAEGLATLKKAKSYTKEKLDSLGLGEYYRYVDDALEVDACGKGNPVRGLPRELSIICHVGDMAQGRLDAYSLLYWLQEKVKAVNKDLAVRFYSVMIPQPFARSYIMQRIYDKYISELTPSGHLALASPWGLYVIAYENELPPIIDISWDDLRISNFPLECNEIVDMESDIRAKEKYKEKIEASKDELENKMWSKFARMFYSKNTLSDCLEPLQPSFPPNVNGFFVHLRFTDMEFSEVEGEAWTCPLCGLKQARLGAFGVNMYPKIAGVDVTTEKWNRKLPGHFKVRGWEGQWKHGFGLDPLCVLDAIAIRELKITGLNGVLSVSVAKPLPVHLLSWIALIVRERSTYRQNPDALPNSASRIDELSKTGGVVVDYVSATASVPGLGEPMVDNLFSPRSELSNIGFLISLGLYPVKYLEVLDTSLPDRLFVTTHSYTLVDFSVTSSEYRDVIPWVAKLLEIAGEMERKDGLEVLQAPPQYAPLRLLSIGNDERAAKRISEIYTRVSHLV
ncbi:MAG: hypothetical protein QXW41_07680 [Fervidicoccaceae archaeon]